MTFHHLSVTSRRILEVGLGAFSLLALTTFSSFAFATCKGRVVDDGGLEVKASLASALALALPSAFSRSHG